MTTKDTEKMPMEDSINKGTDTAVTDTDTKEVITKEASAASAGHTIDTPPTQSKKSVIIERLILCTALFFPLFLATLDTTIVATALPRTLPKVPYTNKTSPHLSINSVISHGLQMLISSPTPRSFLSTDR
jgi:hypothetical protein